MYEMNVKTQAVIERFSSLPSTNDYAKEKRKDGNDLIVIARSQTGGRGTKGRSFSSEAGGLYVSKLTFYTDYPAKNAFRIMQNAAVAVCETVATFGLSPTIKWPNDVYVNGKKICGILIENALCGGNISSSVVGIGVNVNNVLPADLIEIATTIRGETGKTVALEKVEEILLSFLEKDDLYLRYADWLGWLGERVDLLIGSQSLSVKFLAVTDEGHIVVETPTGVQTYASAEVRIKMRKN